jgi:hypothetical protein
VRLKLQTGKVVQESAMLAERLSMIRAALEAELDFTGAVSPELAAAILDHAVVKKDSSKAAVKLAVYLKTGEVKQLTLTEKKYLSA